MDIKFHNYEYLMIKKFTSMCYGRKCVMDEIKIHNKTNLWQGLLSYITLPDGVLKIYKIKCIPNKNNNSIIDKSQKNYVIKRKLKAIINSSEGGIKFSIISKNINNSLHEEPSYIKEMIENYPLRLLTFLEVELNQYFNIPYFTPLSRYLERYNIVEVYLDNILKSRDDSKLPFEIFYCQNIKVLSLKQNYLRQIPTAIGRLSKLEVLKLTDNLLTVQSIPYTLKFCKNLKELYVDNNQLEALPGFLISMNHLTLIHRLGNRNYFKLYFLWYHKDYDHRIREDIWKNDWTLQNAYPKPKLSSLVDICIENIFSSGINFFNEELPESLKHYMSQNYLNYNICNFCNVATDCLKPGYSTVTFLTHFLGNTWVPFQHWACSKECILAIEEPAKASQLEGAKQIDIEYSNYISKFNKTNDNFCKSKKKINKCCIS